MGTLYLMWVPPTSWKIFLYTIRSIPYLIKTGILYVIKEKYVVPFTPWVENTLLQDGGTLPHGVEYSKTLV